MLNDNDDFFSWNTPNVGLAAALIVSGYDLAAIDSRGFKFWEDEEGFKDVVSSYRSGNHSVKAQELYRIIRLLDHLVQSTGMVLTPTHDC